MEKYKTINQNKVEMEIGCSKEPKQIWKQIIETCGGEEEFMKSAGLLNKQETLGELNPYIGPFLLNNGFEKKENNTYFYLDNIYINSECTIVVGKDYYEVQFTEPGLGEVSMYTDSLSVYHLVGILTWFNLIDKNYKK